MFRLQLCWILGMYSTLTTGTLTNKYRTGNGMNFCGRVADPVPRDNKLLEMTNEREKLIFLPTESASFILHADPDPRSLP